MIDKDTLVKKISELVLGAFADGTLDRVDTRQITIGHSVRGDVLHIWSSREWDDFREPSAGEEFANISVASWLDELDALQLRLWSSSEEGGTRPVRGCPAMHSKPAVDVAISEAKSILHEAVVAAIHEVATSEAFASWPPLLGFFTYGFSQSGYHELVAFAHADGAGPLLPLRESRPPSLSIYPHGTLTEHGLTIFYPEGEKDGLDSSSRLSPTCTALRFEDVEMIRLGRRGGELIIRMKDELFDRTIHRGHTEEERGGPSGDDIERRLLEHFESHSDLFFDSEQFPDDKNFADAGTHSDAVDAWMKRYVACNLTNSRRLVHTIFAAQGIEAAAAFLECLPEDVSDRADAMAAYGAVLTEAERFADALVVIRSLEGATRTSQARDELRCLLALGENEQVLERAGAIAVEDDRAEKHMAPLRALALSNLGRSEESVKLLEKLLAEGGRHLERSVCLYALAHAKRKTEPSAAHALVLQSMAKGKPPSSFASVDFADAPELLALYERREALDAAGEVFDAELTAMTKQIAPAELGAMGTGDADTSWSLINEVKVDEVSTMKRLVVSGSFAFAPAQSAGLVVFDIANPGVPKKVAHLANASSFEDAVLVGPLLYLADYSWGLQIADVSEPTKPRLLGCATRYLDRQHGCVAVGDGFAATGGSCTLDIYELTAPEAPVIAASLEIGRKRGNPGNVNALVARGKYLFVAAGGTGLVVLDVSVPSEPRIASQLAIGKEFYAKHIALKDDVAWLSNGETTWLVDIADLEHPRQLCLLPRSFQGAPSSRDEGISVVDDDSGVWSVKDMAKGVSVVRRSDHSGDDRDVGSATDACWVGESLLIANGNRLLSFEKRHSAVVSEYVAVRAAAIAATEEPMTRWVQGILAKADLGTKRSVGSVLISCWGRDVRLSLGSPASVLDLPRHFSDSEILAEEVALSELLADADRLSADPPDGLSKHDVARFSNATQQAWDRALAGVCKRLANSDALAAVGAGRVLLCSHAPAGPIIHAIRLDEDRPWKPLRSDVQERVTRSVEDILTDHHWYRYTDEVVEKASSDVAAFEDVLRLAATGLWPALFVASHLREQAEERVLAAFMTAAEVRNDTRVLTELADYKERPQVRAVLERAYEDADPAIHIPVAVLLDRCDDAKIVSAVAALLSDESGDYSEAELAAEALAGMKTRITDLLEPLLAWVGRADRWANRLPLIAKELFRAGHPDLPEMLVEQAKGEMDAEEYHTMSLSISARDSWDQHDACEAMRLWTGKALAERVIALRDAGDSECSLYPPKAELEPYQASWGYLLRSAWPHLARADCAEWFVDALIARARPGTEYEPDRLMLLSVLGTLFQEQNMAAVVRVARAILTSAADVYDEDTRRSLQRKYYLARLQTGWDLVRERNLEAARQIATAALEDQPSDGQVLFFDARLEWLENSIPAAIEKVELHLKKISSSDAAGRGRLLNLVGCGLDVLGNLDVAISWFEKAAQADPNDAMYLANVAECHHRLGRMPEALRFAKSALAQGADSSYARKIVSELVG